MKYVLAALLLVGATKTFASAACPPSVPNAPCTPDQTLKDHIVDLIQKAQADDHDVERLKREYLALKGGSDKIAALAACGAYRDAKNAQDAKFKLAIVEAVNDYHVGPDEMTKKVALPSDPGGEWVARLPKKAIWDPRVVASGPDTRHMWRIITTDKIDHYVGDVMDGAAHSGFTFPDGEVVIMRETFDRAVKNPGILARALYHESRHFNYLSRPIDGALGRRGWASQEEDERDAYMDETHFSSSVFDLTPKDIAALKKLRDDNARDASNHVRHSYFTPDNQNALLMMRYDAQLNLEADYADLQGDVALQRLEQERRQREESLAEQEARRSQFESDVEIAIVACGFVPQKNADGELEGFKSVKTAHLSFLFTQKMNMNELKTDLMLAHTAAGIAGTQVVPPQCNDGIDIVNQHLYELGFRESLELYTPAAGIMKSLIRSLTAPLDAGRYNQFATQLLSNLEADQQYLDAHPTYPSVREDDPPAVSHRDRTQGRPCHMVTTHLDGRQECW